MKIQRYKFYKDALSDYCSCDLEENEKGSYVLYEDIQPLIERLREAEARGWRPVSAEMPKPLEAVLVAAVWELEGTTEIYMGYIKHEGGPWHFDDVGDDEMLPGFTPTHWMPLPAPPEHPKEGET